MRTFRRSGWLFYVMSLCVLGSAAWFPATIMAQVLPGSPFESSGGGGGATYPVSDSVFSVDDNGDGNALSFDLSLLSADRTYIWPNTAGTVALLEAGNIWTGNNTVNNNFYWIFGTGGGAGVDFIRRSDANTPDALTIALGTTARSLLIIENGDEAFDFAHPLQTNPTLFIHSANQNTAQWISFAHNGTDSVIDNGVGLHRFATGGTSRFLVTSSGVAAGTGQYYAGATIDGTDTGWQRYSAGVWKSTDGSTGIRGLAGGGAAVASAAALPLPTGRVFHVTGTTNVTSITSTNFQSGAVITLIFDGVLTFTDGNNIQIAGNFVTTASDTITLVYDGTNWYEIARAVN